MIWYSPELDELVLLQIGTYNFNYSPFSVHTNMLFIKDFDSKLNDENIGKFAWYFLGDL